jgi:hypothetical protein
MVPIHPQSDAYQAGRLVGGLLVVLICAAIPVVVGITRGQAILGWVGGAITAVLALLFHFFGGLPAALVCSVAIAAVASNRSGASSSARPRRRRKRRREDEHDPGSDPEDDEQRQGDGRRPHSRRYRSIDE